MKRKREKREAWQKLNIHRSWLYRRMFELYKHTRVYISVNKHGEIETARVFNATIYNGFNFYSTIYRLIFSLIIHPVNKSMAFITR